MAIGRIGSFASDAPLQRDYIGNALSETESNGFKYRAERRLIADAKKAELGAKNKEVELAFDDFDKQLIPTITGYSSIDDPIQMYATDAKQKGVDWIRQKNQEKDPYKKAEIQSKINKTTQSFKTLNQYPKLLNEKKAELEEGIKNGKYNERDLTAVTELAKSLDSGKYDMRVDESGVPRMTIYKVDETGTPIGVLEKNISLGDLTNRITPFQKATYDANNGIAEQWASQVGLNENVVQNGFVTTTRKQIDQRVRDSAKTRANEVASMPSEAYEIWQKMGNPPKRTFTDADRKQIADYVEKDLISRVEETYKKDIDQSGALASRKYRDEKEKEAVIISDPTQIKEEGGQKDGVPLQKGTQSFPIGNAVIKTGEGKQQKATNVYVSPGGKIYLRTEEIGFEGKTKSSEKLTPEGKKKQDYNTRNADAISKNPALKKVIYDDDYVKVSESDKKPVVKMLDFGKDGAEIGRYALRMGYKGAEEMQDDFIRRSGGDKFITTPNERANKQKFDEYGVPIK